MVLNKVEPQQKEASTCRGEMRALGQLVAGVGETPLRETGPEEPVGAGRNREFRVWGPMCVQRPKAKGCLKDLEKVVRWGIEHREQRKHQTQRC